MARKVRRTRRGYRNGGVMILVVLLLAALVLLYLLGTGQISANFKNLLNGLQVNLPTAQIPRNIDAQPLAGIDGTPQAGGAAVFAAQNKTAGCTLQGSLPDPGCTPGAAVGSTADQVCAEGYANDGGDAPAGNEIFAAYAVSDDGSYSIDHLVPLELGGSNVSANLWPMPANNDPGPVEKDAAEAYLRQQVCAGTLTLAEAQQQIASNWIQVYNRSLP